MESLTKVLLNNKFQRIIRLRLISSSNKLPLPAPSVENKFKYEGDGRKLIKDMLKSGNIVNINFIFRHARPFNNKNPDNLKETDALYYGIMGGLKALQILHKHCEPDWLLASIHKYTFNDMVKLAIKLKKTEELIFLKSIYGDHINYTL